MERGQPTWLFDSRDIYALVTNQRLLILDLQNLIIRNKCRKGQRQLVPVFTAYQITFLANVDQYNF